MFEKGDRMNIDDEKILQMHLEREKLKYEWALECNKKLVTSEKIFISDLKCESLCGENTKYAQTGLVFFYNSTDELLSFEIVFNNTTVYKIVFEHKETASTYNGWYDELSYAKFLPQPYADPMDLIMLACGFDKIYTPKYKKPTRK